MRLHRPNTDQNLEHSTGSGLIAAKLARQHPQEWCWCGAVHSSPDSSSSTWENEGRPLWDRTLPGPQVPKPLLISLACAGDSSFIEPQSPFSTKISADLPRRKDAKDSSNPHEDRNLFHRTPAEGPGANSKSSSALGQPLSQSTLPWRVLVSFGSCIPACLALGEHRSNLSAELWTKTPSCDKRRTTPPRS